MTGDSELGSARAGIQRERHGRKPPASYASFLSEVPQANALHRLRDRGPQVPMRPMRRRRSDAIVRYTGLDQRRTTAAEIAVRPPQLAASFVQ